mmetsp:Transcript_384/g.672  ORF Transcript_384/g.672 Transcript_384/m.672 type:complete len:158 (-) Transcript_384:1476-1949(-)
MTRPVSAIAGILVISSTLLYPCWSFSAPRATLLTSSRSIVVSQSSHLFSRTEQDDEYDNYDNYFGAMDEAELDGKRRKRPFMDDFDDDDDGYDDEEGLIPNPLLDNIDPEGALGRLDELFSNGEFWRDICVMLLLLNFLDNIIFYDESPFDYFFGYN